MKAVVCTALTEWGLPPALTLMDWPSRPPGPGDIRVALHAGGVNFGDLLVTTGRVTKMLATALAAHSFSKSSSFFASRRYTHARMPWLASAYWAMLSAVTTPDPSK